MVTSLPERTRFFMWKELRIFFKKQTIHAKAFCNKEQGREMQKLLDTAIGLAFQSSPPEVFQEESVVL